jgi:8-oxo-dGTP pyrophosphatase MutT (NUDIX family)
MAGHTRNAGQVLFPSGSIERTEVVAGRVDILATLRREVMEETGLAADKFEREGGWHVVMSGPHMPLIKIMRSPETAEELRECIAKQLANQSRSEFQQVMIVRNADDLHDLSGRMPLWVLAFLREAWRQSPVAS